MAKVINRKAKGYPCIYCMVEAECAANDWCIYDPYNKKCPNHLEGVKQHHKFMKQERKESKRYKDLCY